MTQLVDFARLALLCHYLDAPLLPPSFVRGRRRVRIGDMLVLELHGDPAELNEVRAASAEDMPRILDRFYVWTPAEGSSRRQLLLDSFFDVTARDFNDLVHVEQNRENIRNLIRSVTSEYSFRERPIIFDFGCGPGLSANIACEMGIEVHGFDRCRNMRETARQSGLLVLEPDEFARMPSERYGGVFASYVLHLAPSAGDLKRAWELLKRGGVFVANFHKTAGMAEASFVLDGLASSVTAPTFPGCQYNHGPYRRYVRR